LDNEHVPEKRWKFSLREGIRVHVRVETMHGRVHAFAVVLVADVEGIPVCVSRYDTSHGQPHQDVLGRRQGLIRKDWLIALTMKQALNYAIYDLRNNHEKYLEAFLSH
jgi:hypothetical protein